MQGYHTAASTLNLIRAFTQGGFADLRQVHSWNKGFAANPANQRYERPRQARSTAPSSFMEAAGADFDELKRVEFYTSHEGLLMDYERPMTRIDSRNGTAVQHLAPTSCGSGSARATSTAPTSTTSRASATRSASSSARRRRADDMERLIDKLDPEREPGRLTFITRMGAGKVRDALPPLLEAIKAFDATPLWVTDPMHGNGLTTPTGYKTRRFDDVVDEVQGLLRGAPRGGHPPGRHPRRAHRRRRHRVPRRLGARSTRRPSRPRYESLCDPRLNHMQSLELAFLVAEELAAR